LFTTVQALFLTLKCSESIILSSFVSSQVWLVWCPAIGLNYGTTGCVAQW